jgi:hypothetical protein
MQPWSVASHLPIALINPWADKRIDDHPPLSTITATDGGEIVETPSATTPQDVFGPDVANWTDLTVAERMTLFVDEPHRLGTAMAVAQRAGVGPQHLADQQIVPATVSGGVGV